MKSTHIYRQFDASGLIIFKILTEYRGIQGLTSGAGYTNGLGRDITPIIPIMIEPGAITFMAQLVLTLIYKFDFTAYPTIIQSYVLQPPATTAPLPRLEVNTSCLSFIN